MRHLLLACLQDYVCTARTSEVCGVVKTEKCRSQMRQGCQRAVCLKVVLTWTPAQGTAKPDFRAELVLKRSVYTVAGVPCRK